MPSVIYHRPALAERVASMVTGAHMIAGLPPGLFLAAPRRTGKSTFLELDLIPVLESRNYLVLYIDLWKNRDESPEKLIANLIATHLAKQQGLVARAAASVGLSSVTIHGVKFTIDQVGKTAGASISDALQELRIAANKPLALIVDEAQHVVKHDENMNVMFALKAARDQLNRSSLNLVLLMSGSDRDKLIRLVHSNAAPFLGAEITELPHLEREYTNFVAGTIATARPDLTIVNEQLWEAFVGFIYRPEELNRAINDLTGPMSSRTVGFHQGLADAVAEYQASLDGDYSARYLEMTGLQQAMLTWLLRSGQAVPRMFSRDALDFYGAAVGRDVGPGSAREALNQLRESEPPVVWRSKHGDYALEETRMNQWYEERLKRGEWPPA